MKKPQNRLSGIFLRKEWNIRRIESTDFSEMSEIRRIESAEIF